jgi:IclR family acetate operon transcriptional repressor
VEQAGTVDKAVRVLEALRLAQQPLSLGALAQGLAMPKPTLHRLLVSLAAHQLVEQHDDGRYALGVGLVRLGLSAQAIDPFVRVARRELEREAHAFGETFFLVGARAGHLYVLDKVEGTGLLRAAPHVGAEVPVDTTASGRLFLGLAPALLGDAAAAGRVAPAAIARAVRQGYDLNQGEWIAGLTVVAAPVLARARLFGTVACAGAASQLSGARLAEAIERAKRVASRVESALGGRGEETS